MTEHIRRLKQFFITDHAHHASRFAPQDEYRLTEGFAAQGFTDLRRATERLKAMLAAETPILFPEERIVFTRRNPTMFSLYTKQEMDALKATRRLHEHGEVCNINVDYTRLLSHGLLAKKTELQALREAFVREGKAPEAAYAAMQTELIEALTDLANRYRELAVREGRLDIANTLERVPLHAPATFPEALQMFRILHFAMWLGGNYHNTVGRLDQYLYPYFRADMDAGRLTRETALEWLEEFFLTFNRDSDLYPGMQQGDNGQSIMLGGLNPNGTDSYNELSELCLRASLELSLIDPKINLRVNRNTPAGCVCAGHRAYPAGAGLSAVRQRRCGDPGADRLRLCPGGRLQIRGGGLLGVYRAGAGHGHPQHRSRELCRRHAKSRCGGSGRRERFSRANESRKT